MCSLRPQCLDEIICDKSVVSTIRDFLHNDEMQLLIYGSTGSGKSMILEILVKEYSDKFHFVNGNEISSVRMEEIKKGLSSVFEVKDYFTGEAYLGKTPIILYDNIENSNVVKTFYKKPYKVKIIATSSLCEFRSQKANIKKHLFIERPKTEELIKHVNLEPNCKDIEMAKILVENNFNDIRGIFEDLKILSQVTKRCVHPLRNPTDDIITTLLRVQNDQLNTKIINQWHVNYLAGDRYNLKFYLFENYINFNKDLNNLSDISDLFCLWDNNNDFLDPEYLIITCIIETLYKFEKKLSNKGRVSKLVSSKNQSIINSNRMKSSRSKFLTRNCPLEEMYLVSRIKASTVDKNVKWMNNQFKLAS